MGLVASAAVLAFAAGRYSDIGTAPGTAPSSAYAPPDVATVAPSPLPDPDPDPAPSRRAQQRFVSRAELEAVAPRRQEERWGGGTVYYRNCAHARAMGAAPVMAGDPGYRAGLDRDGDGVGCE